MDLTRVAIFYGEKVEDLQKHPSFASEILGQPDPHFQTFHHLSGHHPSPKPELSDLHSLHLQKPYPSYSIPTKNLPWTPDFLYQHHQSSTPSSNRSPSTECPFTPFLINSSNQSQTER